MRGTFDLTPGYSGFLYDSVKAIAVVIAAVLIVNGNNAASDSSRFDVPDFQARRLHHLHGAPTSVRRKLLGCEHIIPSEIAHRFSRPPRCDGPSLT
jgi:hypothetical protein